MIEVLPLFLWMQSMTSSLIVSKSVMYFLVLSEIGLSPYSSHRQTKQIYLPSDAEKYSASAKCFLH